MSQHSSHPQQIFPGSSELAESKPHRRMSTRQRLLFFMTAWLICLMPFLFWWNTWFGRQLSDKQIQEYLHDEKKPRHIQHALVQIGEGMARHDSAVARWYPEVIRLASYSVEEVRNTDAWVMGQDTSGTGFHQALLKMLDDGSPIVRGNAALSLVRFGDAAGKPQIVALLQPTQIRAPEAKTSNTVMVLTGTSSVGTTIHQGGIVAQLKASSAAGQEETIEVRSPVSGRLRELLVRNGEKVVPGDVIATLDPPSEQVWEALRALYLIGQLEDLPAIQPYERELADIPDHVRQQALRTDRAIREMAK